MHMMDHTNERPYKCELCGKGFKEPQKLRRHKVSHTGEKNHKCSFCGKGFGLRHNMKQHERIHLGQGHMCKYCGKVFSQGTNLKEHESQHVKEKHVITTDPKKRSAQAFAKNRGRPSIMEIDRKKLAPKTKAKVVARVVDEEEDNPDDMVNEESPEAIEKFIQDTTKPSQIGGQDEVVNINIVEAGEREGHEDEAEVPRSQMQRPPEHISVEEC